MRKITVTRFNLLGAIDEENEGMIVNEIYYNDNGQEYERFHYDSDGELEEHILSKIENGLIVEEVVEIQGEESERTIRTYDEKGRVITETRTYLEGGTDITSYEYDGENLVLKHVVDTDGDEGEKEERQYENGKLVKEVKYNLFGNPENEREYEYHEGGSVSEITEITYRDGLPERTVSFYDEQGHLTLEKKYDIKDRLVARTTVIYNENGKAVSFEEENPRGKKVTTLGYDEKGNNTTQEETDEKGNRISYVERTYSDEGELVSAEIIMEPSMYQSGQHYKLVYTYEKE